MECSVFMKATGIRFAQAGYAVFGIDQEGHGKSDGKRCYIQSFQALVDDSCAFFKSIRGNNILMGISIYNCCVNYVNPDLGFGGWKLRLWHC